MSNLHDNVERWLVQDGYPVTETKTEDNFKIIIENIDAFSNNLEIFEPKEQLNQPSFMTTLTKIIEVSEKTTQFLYKSF